jgi:hypothetical protein
MRNRPAVLLSALAIATSLGLAATACGSDDTTASANSVDPNGADVSPPGDIPDDQVFVDYTVPSGDFSVQVPEGWARDRQAGAVTFSDNYNSIRLEAVPARAAPTVASAQAEELPQIEADAPGYQAGIVESVDRTAGPAIHITYQADSAPAPVTGESRTLDVERYEFWKDGTEAIVTLSGAAGADNVDPWRIVTDSFAWL